MELIDIFELPIWGGRKRPPLKTEDDFKSQLPSDEKALELLNEEMAALSEDESTRFDGWTTKGGVMLAASGLLLSLVTLAATYPHVELPSTVRGSIFLLIECLFFFTSVGCFFLSTCEALFSLSPRPVGRLHLEEVVSKSSSMPRVEFLRYLVATKMALYENAIEVVNLKANNVLNAWSYFFYGCAAQALFLLAFLVDVLVATSL